MRKARGENEAGNWFLEVKEKMKLGIVEESRQKSTDEIVWEVGRKNVLTVTFLPSDMRVGDEVEFDNGLFQGKVANVSKLGAVVTVTRGEGSLYWKTKFSLRDVTRAHLGPAILTPHDLKYLAKLRERSDELALSFVNSAAEVKAAIDKLWEAGWDPRQIRINAKIETLDGLANIEGISKQVDNITLARGDMSLVMDVAKAEDEILQRLPSLRNRSGYPIQLDVASNLAESLRTNAGREARVGRLTEEEMRTLGKFTSERRVRKLWLAGETITTGARAVSVIDTFRQAIKDLEES